MKQKNYDIFLFNHDKYTTNLHFTTIVLSLTLKRKKQEPSCFWGCAKGFKNLLNHGLSIKLSYTPFEKTKRKKQDGIVRMSCKDVEGHGTEAMAQTKSREQIGQEYCRLRGGKSLANISRSEFLQSFSIAMFHLKKLVIWLF